jgi:hypothetical protein
MLYFPSKDAPIYLYTDASDYGIGAHLYQLVDGVEQPISFISKRFSKEELLSSHPELIKIVKDFIFEMKELKEIRKEDFVFRTPYQ